MSDEVILNGKQYVSSKRASEIGGYARDYIGQLARSGVIDAQRVGGLWYVYMDSLNSYKRNADTYTPKPPTPQSAPDNADTIVTFDGKEYISAAKAAKITSYNQDYVGQLARSGKILSRQIGNRWYIERKGLLEHKSQKDSLLAAVRAEAVGLYIPGRNSVSAPVKAPSEADYGPMMTYTTETNDLMPALKVRDTQDRAEISIAEPVTQQIPIRVIRPIRTSVKIEHSMRNANRRTTVRAPRISMSRAVNAGIVATFVIVLSYGFVTLKQGSIYSYVGGESSAVTKQQVLSASVASAFDSLFEIVESWIAPTATYRRK